MNRVSVIGLGPVGFATARGFAKLGFDVIGTDILKSVVNKTRRLRIKNIKPTYSLPEAVMNSDISFVCVGTPTLRNGDIEMKYLKKACWDIGKILKAKRNHIVVIRSTMFPGSLKMLREIIEEASERSNIYLAVNPEFLREKTALDDFFNPCYIIVGANEKWLGERVLSYYKKINAPKFIVNEEIAQMIKYANNSFHALKVAFTNELAAICRKKGIDADKLMWLFCKDTQLNISSYYFKPGNAYDGRCLPKDLAVLQKKGKELKVHIPVINAISKSNEIQKRRDKNGKRRNARSAIVKE